MDHGDADATLACTPTFFRQRAGISGTIQILSGSDRRAFSNVARYVERNALRAGLGGRAEHWQWSSLWRLSRENGESSEILSQWPMERPKDWIQFVNEPERESELEDMRSSAQRGRPFGSEDWMTKIAKQLGLGSTMNPRGRPKRL